MDTKGIGIVQEINIKMWRNHPEKNWTLEINGSRYHGVANEWIQGVVYAAVLDAEDLPVARTERLPH